LRHLETITLAAVLYRRGCAAPEISKNTTDLFYFSPSKAEHDGEEWQAGMQALLLVAEHDGPTMFAGVGVMRAVDRHKPKARPAPRRKGPKVYRFIR